MAEYESDNPQFDHLINNMDSDEIPALREWGPDCGEPEDAKTRTYVHPELERRVMKAIARYPQSHLRPDGTVHGIAAVAAVRAVEQWLLEHGSEPGWQARCARAEGLLLPTEGRRDALLRAAVLAGWAARPKNVLSTEQCDAVSEAAANAVLERLAEWWREG